MTREATSEAGQQQERTAAAGTSETAGPLVALLGTGIMGSAMARSMLKAGLRVRAWNRTAAKARELAEAGAEVADSPAAAVAGARLIVTMLADAGAVAEAITAAKPGLDGQVWLQTSTVGVGGCDRLERIAAELGLVFVDAPVLGTREPAERGALVVLASGPDETRPEADPVFDAIGQKTMWLGPAGGATRLKLVVNTWVLGVTASVAEALALAEGLGVDGQLLLNAVAGGPLDCAYLRMKAGAILSGDLTPSFTVAMAGKDARLITEAAAAAGVRLDAAPAIAERFARTAAMGLADCDMAAIYRASFDT